MRPTVSGLEIATNCHHNVGMADWQRLGERVVSRRIELGYRRREDLAGAFEGLSMRTLGDIEAARRERYHPNTLATLEHALRWSAGSIKSVLDGGEPAVVITGSAVAMGVGTVLATGFQQRVEDDPALVKVMNSDLSDDQKRRIVNLLLEEKRRAEKRRAAHADELISLFRDDD